MTYNNNSQVHYMGNFILEGHIENSHQDEYEFQLHDAPMSFYVLKNLDYFNDYPIRKPIFAHVDIFKINTSFFVKLKSWKPSAFSNSDQENKPLGGHEEIHMA